MTCVFHPGRKALRTGILCAPCQADLEERDPGLSGLPVRRRKST